jgi:2-keto-4-pentenoate hydratase/2-oxohepta-3-ene-1,7-dioic acid hydratase in catechol pathway
MRAVVIGAEVAAQTVAWLSRTMTLVPGDVIAAGTARAGGQRRGPRAAGVGRVAARAAD